MQLVIHAAPARLSLDIDALLREALDPALFDEPAFVTWRAAVARALRWELDAARARLAALFPFNEDLHDAIERAEAITFGWRRTAAAR